MDAGKTARPVYRFQPTVQEGEAVLDVHGQGRRRSRPTACGRSFRVVPEGFPVAESHSDLLEGSASQTVTLPETWVKGTLKCQVQVYPSTLADLQKGLEGAAARAERLLRADLDQQLPQPADPQLPQGERPGQARGRAPRPRPAGPRLPEADLLRVPEPGQEQPSEGYEWFGGTAPAHEALTAYGLLQFRDMAKVHDVDPAMLERTQQLSAVAQRDGKGGFQRNPRALDTFGRAPDEHHQRLHRLGPDRERQGRRRDRRS